MATTNTPYDWKGPIYVESFILESYDDTRIDQPMIHPSKRETLRKITVRLSDGSSVVARDIRPELISFIP